MASPNGWHKCMGYMVTENRGSCLGIRGKPNTVDLQSRSTLPQTNQWLIYKQAHSRRGLHSKHDLILTYI